MSQNKDWRILIIDDEPDVREVIAMILTDAGYTLATAADGQAGIEHCGAFDPHIVITDIRMPRMDGLQVLEHLKRYRRDIEVIVITAFGEMDLAVRALQLDASDFINKPIDHTVLITAVERARQRSATRRQLQDYTRFLEEGWTETTHELMETFAYQHKLIESATDGILGCNARDIVVTYNASLEKMLGYSKRQAMHRMQLADFFDPPRLAAFRQAFSDTAYGGPERLYLYETCLRTRSGQDVPVQLSAVAIQEGARLEGLVCFVRDLRELRRMEQQMADQARMLHQDKMISLGRLAASVAHEINNPLSGVLNYLRLMQRMLGEAGRPDRSDLFQRYLTTSEQEVSRCAGIVSNLLTFARKSPVEFQWVPVDGLLRRCLDLSRHRLELGNISVVQQCSADLPPVHGDANQLHQCLLNLIFNAIDAMPQGGRLSVNAAPAPDGRTVLITVEDSGCGIAPDVLPHIFEPFFSTKHEGARIGLGLATTFGIIERHHGTIDVHSRLGQGTVFTIQLPAGDIRAGD